MTPPKPFNKGRKKASKRLVKSQAKRLAQTTADAKLASELVQLAIPIPTKKIKVAAKAVKAVAKKARKPRRVVLLANRGSTETMAKIAKNEAIKANMRQGAVSPADVKKYAGRIREMLKETDPKKRIAMSKRVVRKRKR